MTGDPVQAAEILALLRQTIDADDGEDIVTAFSEAIGALYRAHGRGRISRSMRQALVEALFRAEAAAQGALPAWFYEQRVRHGVVAAFGLVNAWAEAPGSQERREAAPAGVDFILRMVANDLDSLCAGLELQRLTPNPPLTSSVLAAEHATRH